MRRVLALDLGTNTGWAMNVHQLMEEIECGDDIVLARHITSSGIKIFDGEISGWRYLAFKQWLDSQISTYKIDHIVYEETFSKGAYAARILHGFLAMLQFTFAQRYPDVKTRLTMTKVRPSTLKKFSTGYGRATKDDMIQEYIKRFSYVPADDNEVDALWLLEYSKKNGRAE